MHRVADSKKVLWLYTESNSKKSSHNGAQLEFCAANPVYAAAYIYQEHSLCRRYKYSCCVCKNNISHTLMNESAEKSES